MRPVKGPLLPLAECLVVLVVWLVDAGNVGLAAGVSLVGDERRAGHLRLRQPASTGRCCPSWKGFNQHVAPTFSSCQGVDMLPGRPGRGAQEPFLVVDGQYQPAVTAWAQRTAEQLPFRHIQACSRRSELAGCGGRVGAGIGGRQGSPVRAAEMPVMTSALCLRMVSM
jgi:hypothetical protein